MSHDGEAGRSPLNHTREITIEALMEHFANDVMDMDEFERRVDIAHRATNSDVLKELLRDLPGGGVLPAVAGGSDATGLAPVPDYTVTSAAQVKEKGTVVACLSASKRSGRWSPARKNLAVAVMGSAELDFREAILGPGVTEVQIFTVCGRVDIIVPTDLNVESQGIAIMGGFEHVGDNPIHPDPHAPTLRITGLALMAHVEVSVRESGETARDARRRRKVTRREQRRRLRGG